MKIQAKSSELNIGWRGSGCGCLNVRVCDYCKRALGEASSDAKGDDEADENDEDALGAGAIYGPRYLSINSLAWKYVGVLYGECNFS